MAALFDIIDRAIEGGLDNRLRAMRKAGMSIDAMTETFATEGYPISSETVRRWCQRAGIPTHRVPAPTGDAS